MARGWVGNSCSPAPHRAAPNLGGCVTGDHLGSQTATSTLRRALGALCGFDERVPALRRKVGRDTVAMVTTDSLTTIGVVAGVVAAVAAVLTLVWTISGHRRGGRRVSVRSFYNTPVYGPPDQPEFHDDDQVAIAVSHRGGAPVTITNYGVSLRRQFWNRRGKTNMFVTKRSRG
jgi:hypothetical protein